MSDLTIFRLNRQKCAGPEQCNLGANIIEFGTISYLIRENLGVVPARKKREK